MDPSVPALFSGLGWWSHADERRAGIPRTQKRGYSGGSAPVLIGDGFNSAVKFIDPLSPAIYNAAPEFLGGQG